MGPGRVQISFPRHAAALLDSLNRLRLEGKFCDVSVHVGGRVFPAHKSVLAAASPFFHDKLLLQDGGRLALPPAIDAGAFEGLLQLIYCGRLTVAAEALPGHLLVASGLQMWHVVDRCSQILRQVEGGGASLPWSGRGGEGTARGREGSSSSSPSRTVHGHEGSSSASSRVNRGHEGSSWSSSPSQTVHGHEKSSLSSSHVSRGHEGSSSSSYVNRGHEGSSWSSSPSRTIHGHEGSLSSSSRVNRGHEGSSWSWTAPSGGASSHALDGSICLLEESSGVSRGGDGASSVSSWTVRGRDVSPRVGRGREGASRVKRGGEGPSSSSSSSSSSSWTIRGGDGSTHGGVGSIHGGVGSVHGRVGSTHGDNGTILDGNGTVHGGVGIVCGGDGIVHDGDGTVHGGVGIVHDGDRIVHDGDGTIHGGDGTIHGGDGTAHDGVVIVHDGVGIIHDGVGMVHDGVGMVHDGVGIVHDRVGIIHDGDASTHASHGPSSSSSSSSWATPAANPAATEDLPRLRVEEDEEDKAPSPPPAPAGEILQIRVKEDEEDEEDPPDVSSVKQEPPDAAVDAAAVGQPNRLGAALLQQPGGWKPVDLHGNELPGRGRGLHAPVKLGPAPADGKRFGCACGKRFAVRPKRDRHILLTLSLRPFACGACHKRFKLKHHLTEHMKTHDGARGACQGCGRRFRLRSGLAKHRPLCPAAARWPGGCWDWD
ncbi:zinc finger and BTB domain-containing protein 9-like isoform X3 [Chiroxiphia lanceolata]|uniref:zinc finger and BTB domain-containing protein 9-like isoform X3 n=1 Tax=Chiroxiphia lanceolata TaxID=296741 RepID=UPI0013CECAA6|nr:zinc finger and BTB domain-containing protein 9-like isoform X3 [Chiroxiphia lanceolata]